MSQFNFVAVFDEFLIRLLELFALRVPKDVPEISDTENDIGALEGPLERLDVVKVGLDDLDALCCPCFGCWRFGVASYTANGITRGLEEGVGNRAALDMVLVTNYAFN